MDSRREIAWRLLEICSALDLQVGMPHGDASGLTSHLLACNSHILCPCRRQ